MTTTVSTDTAFNLEKVREAYSAEQQEKRRKHYARQEAKRRASGIKEGPSLAEPSMEYRYPHEVWSDYLIVRGDGGKFYKVPFTVTEKKVTFGAEKQVTQTYVELSNLRQRGATIDLAGLPSLERKKGGPDNWVEKAGGLPPYIERIAKHLHYEEGMPISRAIAVAVNTVKRWAKGGTVTKGGTTKTITPATRAKAAKAVAEWEAKKAKAKINLATPNRRTRAEKIAALRDARKADRAAEAKSSRGGGSKDDSKPRWTHGWVPANKAAEQVVLERGAGYGGKKSHDSQIKAVQGRLVDLGLLSKRSGRDNGKDGLFGPQTEAAIRKFQKKAGLSVTGKADAKTIKALSRRQTDLASTAPDARHGRLQSMDLAALLDRVSSIGDPAARDEARAKVLDLAVMDLASVGDRKPPYDWKHGYIPISPAAMRIKAKGSQKALARVKRKYGNPSKAGKVAGARVKNKSGKTDAEKQADRNARASQTTLADKTAKDAEQRQQIRDRATVTRLGAKQRSERTPAEQKEFQDANARLRGEKVEGYQGRPVTEGTKKSDQDVVDEGVRKGKAEKDAQAVLAEARADALEAAKKKFTVKQASEIIKGTNTHGATVREQALLRKDAGVGPDGKPVGYQPRQGGGEDAALKPLADAMKETQAEEAQLSEISKRLTQANIPAATRRALEKTQDKVHTRRGKRMWPDLDDEAARYRSVQDLQYRTGAVKVGSNWQRPDWYKGPDPQRVQQGDRPKAGSSNASYAVKQARLAKIKTADMETLAKWATDPDMDKDVKEAARVEAVTRKNASMGRGPDGVTPTTPKAQVMNPRTPTGVGVLTDRDGNTRLMGPDGQVDVPKEAMASTEALQKWTDANLAKVDKSGASQRAKQAEMEARSVSRSAQFRSDRSKAGAATRKTASSLSESELADARMGRNSAVSPAAAQAEMDRRSGTVRPKFKANGDVMQGREKVGHVGKSSSPTDKEKPWGATVLPSGETVYFRTKVEAQRHIIAQTTKKGNS